MGKGVKIALLCLVFVVCVAAGYFLGEIRSSDSSVKGGESVTGPKGRVTSVEKKADVEKKTAEEQNTSVGQNAPVEGQVSPAESVAPVLSAVPVISSEAKAPVKSGNSTYSYKAEASVESGDLLVYVMYADEACSQEIMSSSDGSFTGIPANESGTYYLRVQNVVSKDFSPVTPIKGFDKPKLIMYQKITKEELDNIININKSYSAAPKGFSHRISKSFTIVVNGANPGDGNVSDIDEICAKTMMDIWSHVSIDEISYDTQNRMTKLVITVKY